jgi:RHS repeat-associated protein
LEKKMTSTKAKWSAVLAVWIFLYVIFTSFNAEGSGVSPSRLRLPKGPGSLEGVGENVEANLNMGLAGYSVPILLPEGYNGFSPDLSLAYSSGNGASVVGIGWSLGLPTIERMTSSGLPVYDASDKFAANGGKELVRIPGTSTYRERFEGSFVRYTWVDEDEEGREGYWMAEYPDGLVGYFGADAEGELDPEARVAGSGGVFRYHLTETRDSLDHRIVYHYSKDQGTAYLNRIEWAFSAGEPHYAVNLAYEERKDALSDGKPGVEIVLRKRLSEIAVTVGGEQLRRYALSYEPYEQSGGLTRLQQVVTFGTDNAEPFPIQFSFSYTGVFDPACEQQETCHLPYLHDMGAVGEGFGARNSDLLDFNGDGLPDVLDTSEGKHRIYVNQLPTRAEDHVFSEPLSSRVATGGSLLLSADHVELLDLDGNGHSDLVDGLNGRVLWNLGNGDWEEEAAVENQLPDFTADANLSFFDYDGDKRPDVMHSDNGNTWFYLNEANGRFSTDGVLGEPIGWGFKESGLKTADMNGDGLQDAVLILGSLVTYRLYLGFGNWSAPVEMFGLSDSFDASTMRLVDLNGDSLSDAVAVLGNEVLVSFNESGQVFGPLWRVQEVEGTPIPEKTAEMSIRFADMNGTGSTDVVWIDGSGGVKYLELFPKRANLLSRVENGIGKVMEIYYDTTVTHMAEDGGTDAWVHRLPHPMLTVERIETYDTLSRVRQVQTFHFSNGYYDGEERQFKGFQDVVVETDGDDSMEPGKVVYRFDVGDQDRYRSGELTRQILFSGDSALHETRFTYEECDVAGVPKNTAVPVRYMCQTAKTQILKEGRDEAEWATLEERYEYDAYGNQVETSNLGVTKIGGDGCGPCEHDGMGAPCGAGCVGDESFVETDFIDPSDTQGRWLLNLPYRVREYGVRDSEIYAETLTYYDGADFKGLPLGEAISGLKTRVTKRAKSERDETVDVERYAHDQHGNVTTARDANGNDILFEYDADSLKLTAEERRFERADGPSYALRLEATYHPVLESVVSSTDWQRIEADDTEIEAPVTLYDYDPFGRIIAMAKPGDTLDAPSETYEYELASPISRIVTRIRSIKGKAPDMEKAVCFDGMGRKIQERVKSKEGEYLVSGFLKYNVQGKARETFQPYTGASGACDLFPPKGVLSTEVFFDASGRILEATLPDAEVYGTPSTTETEYGPLWIRVYDAEDTDPQSPHHDTPTTTWVDGLKRKVKIEQTLADEAPIVTTFTYDSLGRLRSHIDTLGNEKYQTYDLLGRVTSVMDPDTGLSTFKYDPAGNKIETTDSREITVKYAYDEAGRVLSQWDAASSDTSRIDYHYDTYDNCDPEHCTHLAGKMAATVFPLGDGTMAMDQFGYDARGRAVYTARQLGGRTLKTRREYDNADRLVATIHPDGTEVKTVLDQSGRVTEIPGFVSSVLYNDKGLPEKTAFANQTVTTRHYDLLRRLETLSTKGPKERLVQGYGYTYDRAGNILAVEDHRKDDGQPTAQGEYRYDALYRLTTARLDTGRTRPEELTFAFDPIGNLVKKLSDLGSESPAHVGQYTYGGKAGPHAVTKTGNITFEYDTAGNMITHGDDRYEWNHLGQLVSVETGNNQRTEFGYDANGHRIYKRSGTHRTHYISSDFEIRDGIAATYVHLDGSRIAKKESAAFAAWFLPDLAPIEKSGTTISPKRDGKITAADAWMAHAVKSGLLGFKSSSSEELDPEVMLAAAAKGTLLESGEQTIFLHQNHLGTTAVTTDIEGNELQRTEHYPFGEVRYQSHYLEEYAFTGQERDPSTGLSYHAARYLDPKLGRWISADPMFALLGEKTLKAPEEALNLYTYASNNPIVYTDPDGTIPILGILVRAVAAVARAAVKAARVVSRKGKAIGRGALKKGKSLATHAKSLKNKSVVGIRKAASKSVDGVRKAASKARELLSKLPRFKRVEKSGHIKDGWTLSSGKTYGSKTRLDYHTLPKAPMKGAKGVFKYVQGRRVPHYHRRGPGGIGLHRPWQAKPSWRWWQFWKRF